MSKSMLGIDISNWQKGIDLSKVKCDFVIAKATEGSTYVDKTMVGFLDKAQKLGKCIGFYHFARPENNSAIKEAQHFYKHTKDYFKKGIPVLDWESVGVANVAWAKQWLDYIYMVSAVKPMIYMSESVANKYNWKAVADAGYGLWVAKYRDYTIDYNYDMQRAGAKPSVKYWPVIAMWQWTSSGRLTGYSQNLDCDIFYGDKDAWKAYAVSHTTSNPSTANSSKNPSGSSGKTSPSTKKPSIDTAVANVIAGKYGNGTERTKALQRLGFNTAEIATIQDKVNKHLQAAKKTVTHIVKKGDTLSAIAKKYGTTVKAIASKNGLKDPNKIYPGQKLKI